NAPQPATNHHAFAVERRRMRGVGRHGLGSHRALRPLGMALRPLSIMLVVATFVAAPECAAAGSDDVIVVQGNRRLGADAIGAHFHASPGGELDQFALDGALKELYATGAFDDVKIVRSGAGVVVKVVEARLLGRLQFEGNKKLKDADLEKAVQLKP